MSISTKLVRFAAVTATIMALGAGSVFAQATKIKIGTEGAYPPFNTLTADGKLEGFDIDIANALCAQLKAECELVTQDWDGIIPALQAGKFDAIIASMSITEERKEKVDFTNKYYTTPLSVVALTDSALTATEPEALAGKTVGAQAGTTQSIYADEHYAKAGAEVKSYPTQEEAVQDGDLKQELNQLTKDFRGRVEPLPQVKPYEPVPYTAEGQVDPFRPERIDVAQRQITPSASSSRIAQERDRPKEPLEAFPLESIQMMGTITQANEVFALVKAGPNLYRVKKGNYMGQNFGVVTGIDESQISLKELIQDSGGEWVERNSALQLVETKR